MEHREVYAPVGRAREPRGMTMLDVMALVVGFSIVFAMISQIPSLLGAYDGEAFGARFGSELGWMAPLLELMRIALPFGAAVSVVVLARRLAHGGFPRPAEWVTLLLGVTFVIRAFPNVEYGFLPFWRNVVPGLRDDRAWWLWGLAGLIACGSGLALLLVFRRRLPTRVMAIGLVALLGLTLWWPVAALGRTVPALVWQFHDLPIVTSSWPYSFHAALLTALGRLPLGLVYGTILAAALQDASADSRSRWTWPEWAGMAAALLLLPCWFVLDYALTWHYGWYMPPAWALAVTIASWWLAERYGPAWNRLLDARYDRHQSTSPPPEG